MPKTVQFLYCPPHPCVATSEPMFWDQKHLSLVLLILLLASALIAEEKPQGAESPGLMEAVQSALLHNRQLQSQQWQVAISRGTLQQAQGQFDTTFNVSATRGHVPQDANTSAGVFRTKTDTLSYTASVSRQLRDGVTVSPAVTVSQTHDNYQYLTANGTGQASLTVTVPLLKGRGRLATDGSEQAARLGLHAARLVYAQAVASTASSTADAYWVWLAARRTLDAQRGAEERAQRLLVESQALVKADMVPAADLGKLEANLAAAISSRLLAERSLFGATQSLGLAMGLNGEDLDRLAPAAGKFPDPGTQTVPAQAVAIAYGRAALHARQDYLAARANTAATRILFQAARINERPEFDVGLQAGYTGLDVGNFSDPLGPLGRNVAGPAYGVTFTLAWPFANHTAKGYTLQQRAQYEKAQLQAADLAATIESGVANAVQNLRTGMQALRQAQRASELYAASVKEERQKFQLGESTVIDQLTIEDKATQADLNLINARLLYAEAIVSLRYQTGTLVEAHGDGFRLREGALRTPPPARP